MNIVFVCTGNTCRSPMAEGIAKNLLAEHRISSKGIMVPQAMPVAEHAKQLMTQHQYTIKAQSESFTENDAEADLILTMTPEHKWFIQQQYGSEVNVHVLTEYVDEPGYISDPFGGSQAIYEETFNQLYALIEALKHKIHAF